MENSQSIEILTQALELANKAGVYNLKDSALIFTALNEVSQVMLAKNEEVLPQVEAPKNSKNGK